MTASRGNRSSTRGGMTSNPADTTFSVTTGCILFVTAVALAFIVYSIISLIGLLPAQLPQRLTGAGF